MALIKNASWNDVTRLRKGIEEFSAVTFEEHAANFVSLLQSEYDSIVLTRVFLVLPFARLPELEKSYAEKGVADISQLTPQTQILTLLGSAGKEHAWNERTSSKGHLAIPLIDRKTVENAPMIYNLLASLGFDFLDLGSTDSIFLRSLAGGLNKMFYVPDANSAVDAAGRKIIPAQDFVKKYKIHTVFGMGGAYLNGAVVLSIVFTSEDLTQQQVDLFPSLIGTFKIMTAPLVESGVLFQTMQNA